MINLIFILDLFIYCDFYEYLFLNIKFWEFEKVNSYIGNMIYRIFIIFFNIFIEIRKNMKIIYFWNGR